MDYKYIEQLLERYWNCETSLEEEQILRSFFRQKEVPAHLLRYKQLFAYQDVEKEKGLGDDFDTRILTRIERPVVKAQRLTMRTRFMPLFKAAAMIAVLFLMGTVMQHAMEGGDSDTVSVHDEYQNSTTDPQVAYEPVLPTDTVTKITADDTGTCEDDHTQTVHRGRRPHDGRRNCAGLRLREPLAEEAVGAHRPQCRGVLHGARREGLGLCRRQ